MPSWFDFENDLKKVAREGKGAFVQQKSIELLQSIANRQDCNVIYYASGFLEKPHIPHFTSITGEDINGFMTGLHGQDFSKRLLLILHTPGGSPGAAQTIVEYLRSKYSAIDVAIPTYAMSAGTMIALACDRIIMGRQSQLGPTDPQLVIDNRGVSAHSVVNLFAKAKKEITTNPVLALAWNPILAKFGTALPEEAGRAISYGTGLVEEWLQKYMFADKEKPADLAKEVAEFFGGTEHGSHSRRIDRQKARQQHLNVVDLEDDQNLQDEILSLYHLSTIAFGHGPAAKMILSQTGKTWIRSLP